MQFIPNTTLAQLRALNIRTGIFNFPLHDVVVKDTRLDSNSPEFAIGEIVEWSGQEGVVLDLLFNEVTEANSTQRDYEYYIWLDGEMFWVRECGLRKITQD